MFRGRELNPADQFTGLKDIAVAEARPSLSVVTDATDLDPTVHRLPELAQYGITAVLVSIATFLAFIASSVIPGPGLTLIFVLPVVVASSAYGFGPTMFAILASVFAYDFFFTQPYFSVRMTDPSEVWAAALLLGTAAIVSSVQWRSRRNAFLARRLSNEADELQQLAKIVLLSKSQSEIYRAAATTIGRILGGPAAIVSVTDSEIRIEASVRGARLTEAEFEAVRNAVASRMHFRAETYPHDQSRFDVWPINLRTGRQFAVCVKVDAERIADASQIVEIVSGFLASAAGAGPKPTLS